MNAPLATLLLFALFLVIINQAGKWVNKNHRDPRYPPEKYGPSHR